MEDILCLNSIHVLLIIICIVITGVYQYKLNEKLSAKSNCSKIIEKSVCPPCNTNKPVDIVKEYDRNKINDPLEEPTKRLPRHNMYPMYIKNLFGIRTRGEPDTFRQVGILIDETTEGDNKILRLFGRQEYPSSNRYEYYTSINSGYDSIKVPLDLPKKQELYDDDTVMVNELNKEYKVKIYKYDQPRYYPSI